MGFQDAVRSCFSKYVTFSGRAPRSEFWFFVLFTVIGSIILGVIDTILFPPISYTDTQPLSSIFGLLIFLPQLSATVRRLHDLDRSGWWWWLWLIPLIGWIILIVWYATKGTSGPNRFGPDPFGDDDPFDATDYDISRSSIPNVRRDD